jgi:anti-sigma factor RsiW
MNCTEVQSALSELLDGTLPRDRRAQVEAHLESCADCRAVLADLRRIREQARALPKVVPPEALWQKVSADYLRQATSGQAGSGQARSLSYFAKRDLAKGEFVTRDFARRNFTRRSVLTGLAAAAALVLATSGGIYYLTRQAAAPAPAPVVDSSSAHAKPGQSVQSIESELQLAVQHYENAIAGLDKVAKEGESVLTPETTAVLAKSNAILDQAVSESQAALRTQPTSEVARASLFEALQRKVSLLRDTVALINEMRKGDSAGTARVVGSLGKS